MKIKLYYGMIAKKTIGEINCKTKNKITICQKRLYNYSFKKACLYL